MPAHGPFAARTSFTSAAGSATMPPWFSKPRKMPLARRMIEALLVRREAIGKGCLIGKLLRLRPANTRMCGAPRTAARSIHRFVAAISASSAGPLGSAKLFPTAVPVICTPRRKAWRFTPSRIRIVNVRRKIIARQFGARHPVVGAPVDEIRHRPRGAVATRRLRLSLGPAEVVAKTISRQTKLHPAATRSAQGLDGRKAGSPSWPCRGQPARSGENVGGASWWVRLVLPFAPILDSGEAQSPSEWHVRLRQAGRYESTVRWHFSGLHAMNRRQLRHLRNRPECPSCTVR